MSGTKRVVISIEFDTVIADDYESLEAVRVLRHDDTTLTEGELGSLGEQVAQSDRWQVDNWNAIQTVLSGAREAALQ